jgi:hypothetical protein
MGKQTLRQAARLAASEVCAKGRRERAERDRRLEELAIEVLTALGKRDATTIAATEQRAGVALQAMITDESLRCRRRCNGAPKQNRPPRSCPVSPASRAGPKQRLARDDSTRAADIR